jgi:hypothetical protein
MAPAAFTCSDQKYPLPLPPVAANCCEPRGATVAVSGVMLTPGPTEMVAVAELPRLSTSFTVSDFAPTPAAV